MAIRELAHAKINLTLTVLGRRADGYHELESLVTFADVHDLVTLEPGAGTQVTVAGQFAGDIAGENLLIRTLSLVREAEPRLGLGSITLEKNLPVAAGLGGGSADAAALLRAIEQINPGYASSVPWLEIAAKLGADVPVCLASAPAFMCGIGERTAPITSLPQVDAVIVNPRLPLATADVFSAMSAKPAEKRERAPEPPVLERFGDLIDYMRTRGNDLEAPAMRLVPAIGGVMSALRGQPGCRLAAMSGSGPTCFGIFADGTQASRAAEHITAAHSAWWVQATRLRGSPST